MYACFRRDPQRRLHLFHRCRLDREAGLVRSRAGAFERVMEFVQSAAGFQDRIRPQFARQTFTRGRQLAGIKRG